MNPWHDSIVIVNRGFIVNQEPEWVNQVWKMGRNWREKVLLLDPEVKLCLMEIPHPFWIFFIQVMHFWIFYLINLVSNSPSSNLIDCTPTLKYPTNICARHSMVNRVLGIENGVIGIFWLECLPTNSKMVTTITIDPHNICLQAKILPHLHNQQRQGNIISSSDGRHPNVNILSIWTGSVVRHQQGHLLCLAIHPKFVSD